MIKKLRLRGFKNFKDAELNLGPFTILVGTNAAGKSNIREALRFLHAISRGYILPEIIGEKWGEGGYLQWRGISGGNRELFYFEGTGNDLLIEVELIINHLETLYELTYGIEVAPGFEFDPPFIKREYLYQEENLIFDTDPKQISLPQNGFHTKKVLVKLNTDKNQEFIEDFPKLEFVETLCLAEFHKR